MATDLFRTPAMSTLQAGFVSSGQQSEFCHTNKIDKSGYIHIIGMTENHFKTRYNHHNSSFRLPHKRSTTTLSEHLRKLKDAGVSYKTE